MEVKSYACEKDSTLFVVMPATSTIDVLPDQIKEVTGKLSLFKEFDLSSNAPLIVLDPKIALSDIDTKGYHILKAKINIEEKNAGTS